MVQSTSVISWVGSGWIYWTHALVCLRQACRLKRGMARISLEGFLLSPVQKICRYPVQLKELLEHTPPGHPDHPQLERAAESMKRTVLPPGESVWVDETHGAAAWWVSLSRWNWWRCLLVSHSLWVDETHGSVYQRTKAKDGIATVTSYLCSSPQEAIISANSRVCRCKSERWSQSRRWWLGKSPWMAGR